MSMYVFDLLNKIYKKIDILFYILCNITMIMQISTMNMNETHVNTSRDKTTRSIRRRMKRQRYKMNDQAVGTNFRECVESFKKSREYMKLEKCAKTLAFDAVEQPDWEGVDTVLLRTVFVLLLEKHKESLIKPLRKYNRRQLIIQNTSMWKDPTLSLVDSSCMICYETITHKTPTITLLCNHSLCTSCFLKCCRHNGNLVLETCPMCRAIIRL